MAKKRKSAKPKKARRAKARTGKARRSASAANPIETFFASFFNAFAPEPTPQATKRTKRKKRT